LKRPAWLGTALAAGALVALTAGFVAFAVWSAELFRGSAGHPSRTSPLEPVLVTGPEETVFDWSRDACEPEDIPDSPARAFRDAAGDVNLIATHFVNRRSVGRSLDRVRHRCAEILRSAYDPDPARFDDRQWLVSPYTTDGRTVHALVHDEYQGHTHPGRCPSGDYQRCWYNAITYARSQNGGTTFVQPPAAQRLVAAVPYTYTPDRGPYGIFQPSNVLRHRSDGHWYTLVFAERHERQRRGVCLMRTRRLGDPGSWRAWDGEAFTVRFANPYAGPAPDPADHVCAPVSYEEIGDMTHSLTWNTYFGRYMLVSPTASRDPRSGRAVYGFYYSLSSDLVHWEPRKLIRESELLQSHRCGDPDPLFHPAILDPDSRSRNFETAGRNAYLYFTRIHADGCDLTLDRDLVRVPVQFSK
jgi:hypothetical protein